MTQLPSGMVRPSITNAAFDLAADVCRCQTGVPCGRCQKGVSELGRACAFSQISRGRIQHAVTVAGVSPASDEGEGGSIQAGGLANGLQAAHGLPGVDCGGLPVVSGPGAVRYRLRDQNVLWVSGSVQDSIGRDLEECFGPDPALVKTSLRVS